MTNLALALRSLIASLALATLLAAAPQEQSHTAVLRTEHFEVRYRPGSKAGAFVEREAWRAERDLAEICAALGLEPKGRYRLFLYDDLQDLALTTGVDGTGGFSAGDASHVPADNDQTRFHELVHIVAHDRVAEAGDEPRSLFFAEGLSNALLVFVHGVHVHSVARYYHDQKALPSLSEMAGASDFYAWLGARPGFNAYDVAGSFLRFLFDTYGAKKTLRYYGGASSIAAFGIDLAKLESGWLEALGRFELRPEVRALLEERHGDSARLMVELARPPGLPAELLGAATDWIVVTGAKLIPDNGAEWKHAKDGITARSAEATWSVCELGDERYADCAVRATVHTTAPVPIQVRLGEGNQAMLVNGTFVYRFGAPFAHSPLASMDANRKLTDFVLVRRAGTLEVWIDGRRCLNVEAETTASPIGLGFHGGDVRFERVAVRKL